MFHSPNQNQFGSVLKWQYFKKKHTQYLGTQVCEYRENIFVDSIRTSANDKYYMQIMLYPFERDCLYQRDTDPSSTSSDSKK